MMMGAAASHGHHHVHLRVLPHRVEPGGRRPLRRRQCRASTELQLWQLEGSQQELELERMTGDTLHSVSQSAARPNEARSGVCPAAIRTVHMRPPSHRVPAAGPSVGTALRPAGPAAAGAGQPAVPAARRTRFGPPPQHSSPRGRSITTAPGWGLGVGWWYGARPSSAPIAALPLGAASLKTEASEEENGSAGAVTDPSRSSARDMNVSESEGEVDGARGIPRSELGAGRLHVVRVPVRREEGRASPLRQRLLPPMSERDTVPVDPRPAADGARLPPARALPQITERPW